MPIYTPSPYRTGPASRANTNRWQQGSHYHNCLRTATTDIVDGKATFDSCRGGQVLAHVRGLPQWHVRSGRSLPGEPSAKDPAT